MNILVTGSAGFIGSHLCERLVALGHKVVGIDCYTDYYARELKELNAKDIKDRGVETLELDLSKDDLGPVIKDIEVVYHLAAQPGISSTTPFETYMKNNIISTQRLLNVAQVSGGIKGFVNIATSSIYGKHATDNEEKVPKPTSYYGVTKLAAEQLALALYRDKGFPACSVRPFSVYGERERPEKLYPKLINSILEDKEFPLFEGSEKHLRSYTYVGDIVDGLVSILGNLDVCLGEIFNLGTDTAITTGEGISIVEDIIGRKAKISIKPKRAGDQQETHANIEKARKVLNYQPRTTPKEGLAKEVAWYKEKIWKKIRIN